MAKKKDRFKIAVLGAGSWGITLAYLLHCKGNEVRMWEFDSRQSKILDKKRIFPPLKNFIIPGEIEISSSLKTTIEGADFLVIAIPSKAFKKTVEKIKKIKESVPRLIISAVKGFDYASLKRPTEILREELGKGFHISVLSGPSHAEEVIKRMPTAIVAASSNPKTARQVQELFFTDYFRVYTSDDIKGVELGGALKNVIAVASGITAGLGLGDNTRAALITRGNSEIKQLGIKMGARHKTFNGLSGIGDLIVTCFSMHSRNYRFGKFIGEGMSFSEAEKKVGTTAEGIYTVRSCVKLSSKYDVPMPVCKKVYDVLYRGKNPAEATGELMTRPLKSEYPEGG